MSPVYLLPLTKLFHRFEHDYYDVRGWNSCSQQQFGTRCCPQPSLLCCQPRAPRGCAMLLRGTNHIFPDPLNGISWSRQAFVRTHVLAKFNMTQSGFLPAPSVCAQCMPAWNDTDADSPPGDNGYRHRVVQGQVGTAPLSNISFPQSSLVFAGVGPKRLRLGRDLWSRWVVF
jgi:hypothetical protein